VSLRDIEDVHDQADPLDVSEKVETKTRTSRGASDEPRDVSHRHALIQGEIKDPQIGDESGERIIGDLRLRRSQGPQKGGLTGIGNPHQPDVGQELQLQEERSLLARPSLLGDPRRAARGRSKGRVAPAPSPAAGHQDLLPVFREVPEEPPRLLVRNHRTKGNPDDDIRPVTTALLLPLSVAPVWCPILLLVFRIEEGPHRSGGFHIHAASPSAVPSVRPAPGDVLFTPKADAAFSALARSNLDPGNINEHSVHPMTDHRRPCIENRSPTTDDIEPGTPSPAYGHRTSVNGHRVGQRFAVIGHRKRLPLQKPA